MRRPFLVLSLYLITLPVFGQAEFAYPGLVYWATAAQGDAYGWLYPINYHLQDTDGNSLQPAGRQYGTADLQGKYFVYQINDASRCFGDWAAYPYRWLTTHPVNAAGFKTATLQYMVCHAKTEDATPGSVIGGGLIDSDRGLYETIGSATKVVVLFGSSNERVYQALPQESGGMYAYNPAAAGMAILPDKRWYSIYARSAAATDVANATFIMQLGTYHFDLDGVKWLSVGVRGAGGSATSVLTLRLNKDITTPSRVGGARYP